MDIGKRIRFLREEKKITQEELANYVGTTKQTIFKYETGIITNIPMNRIIAIAKVLNCTPEYLLGWSSKNNDLKSYSNISPIHTKKIPMLGEIACGKPIYANEDRESYVLAGTDVKADFCLTCRGDSMIGARIHDGDIVFCRKQDIVDNGDIAVVIIEDEATLKRFYYYKEQKKLVLQAENPAYQPFVYVGEELNSITVLGKAIAFQSDID